MTLHSPNEMTRRGFLAATAGAAGAAALGASLPARGAQAGAPKLVVVSGAADKPPAEAAYLRTKAAVDRLGGMEKFVKGKIVIVKMNATERSSQDANTSPAAAAGLLRLCKESGAKGLAVIGQEWGGFDVPREGQPTLRKAILDGGANIVELPHYWEKNSRDAFKVANPTKGQWHEMMVATSVFDPEMVLINLSRLKTHPHCVFTGCLKNIIGLTRCMYGFHMVDDLEPPKNAGKPELSDGWHIFPEKLAYAYKEVIGPRIALNILDADQPTFGWRGPAPERIQTYDAHTTIAGHDAVAIDVYGCGMLHAQRPKDYPQALGDWSKGDSLWIASSLAKRNYLVVAAELGAGKADLAKGDIDEVKI